MTTNKLFDELYALQIPKINQYLDKNKPKLVQQSITECTKRIQRISATLPTEQQELVDVVLGYALKEKEEENASEEDTVLASSSFAKDTSLQDKRYSDAKHTAHKKENIEYAEHYLGKELKNNPHDPQLTAKRSSVQKQKHLLTKDEQ